MYFVGMYAAVQRRIRDMRKAQEPHVPSPVAQDNLVEEIHCISSNQIFDEQQLSL